MTDPHSPSPWRRLDDPAAARVLADAGTRQFFEPFLWRERRVSDVARELGVSKTAMLYRVRQFLRLGLLEVTRTVPRAGRALRLYRATSRGYFVPFVATHAASVQALYQASIDHDARSAQADLMRAWSALADDPRHFGLYTYGDEGGLRSHVLLPAPPDPRTLLGRGASVLDELLGDTRPAVWDNTTTLSLTPADAKALQRALDALHRDFQRRAVAGGVPHVLRLTLAPVGG